MIIGYADPPYPGQSKKHYSEHPDYAGEVDHTELATELLMYDGWVLHTSVPALHDVLSCVQQAGHEEYRVCAWVKPFCAFKRNVPVAYAWEPIIVKAARKPVVSTRVKPLRDFFESEVVRENIAMKKGLVGAKPEPVCHWVFETLGMRPEDSMVDMYPGSGAVTDAWRTWKLKFNLPLEV